MTATLPRLGRNASKIAPKAMRWLVPNVLAHGITTCVTGDGGVGKSTLLTTWMADLSVARPLVPGGKVLPAMESVVVSTEESAESVIVPKLMAAGADLTKVTILDSIPDDDGHGGIMPRGLRLPGDADAIMDVVADTGAALLVLDPVAELLDDKHSANNDQEVRRALATIRRRCAQLGCALAYLQHVNKKNESMGSGAWKNMARVQLRVDRHPDDATRSVLHQAKTNYGLAPAWEFHMEAIPFARLGIDDPDGDNTTARVIWDGLSSLDPTDLTGATISREERAERLGAGDLIVQCIEEGTNTWKPIMAKAREYGFSERAMRTAAAEKGIRPSRESFGGSVVWKRAPAYEPATPAPNGNGHHLHVVPPRTTVPVCSTCGLPVDPDVGCRRCANSRVIHKPIEELS